MPRIVKTPFESVVVEYVPLPDFARIEAPAIGAFDAASMIVPFRFPVCPPAARAGPIESTLNATVRTAANVRDHIKPPQ
jgi:hypothetical protein